MKKNSKIRLRIETETLEKLRKEAMILNLSISELCRQKLIKNQPLIIRIEEAINRIEKSLHKNNT